MNTTLGLHASIRLLASLLAITCLASCGGGGVGSGGTGRMGGFAAGTVNGFASVIVDGVEYDDRTAPVVSETAPGVDTISEVKLGQRVAIDYATAGVAAVIRVDAALVGPVRSVGAASLTLLGQTVVINSNGAAGPITQFGGGYAQTADVHAGDAVEVHGVLVRQGGAAVIQATRVDKLGSLPSFLRVTGIVGAVDAGAHSMQLGSLSVDLASAIVLPAGTSLAVGQAVTVLAPASSLSSPADVAIVAAEVRVRALTPGLFSTVLSGSVSNLDASAKTFVVDGQLVRYGAASVTPTGTALANGLYVRASGMTAADGALDATDVAVRNAGSDSEAELHGNISAFDAATSHFVVRGVTVDASQATLSGCPAGGLANGQFVEVHGATIATGVLARTVQCESESAGSTVEREGRASAVDLAARTFTLTTSGGTVAVRWTDTTFFGSVTAATLAGRSLQVQGTLVAGVLVATKIEGDD